MLRGSLEWRGLAETEDGILPWWFYLLMPVVSGFVGWWTNKVAILLTWYPYKFWGINWIRFESQPIGLFGWQGIIPSRAAEMARDALEIMTTHVFDMREIFSRIDQHEAAKHLQVGFGKTLDRVVDDISDKYVISKETSWQRSREQINKQLKVWIEGAMPDFLSGFMKELIDNLEDNYDMEHMVVTEMVNHPELLVGLFQSVGANEVNFIIRSGLYFGFVFGCIQTILFRWVIPSPTADYLLPLLGFLVGYITNWIALKMIFQPVEPKIICGMRFHGVFMKRQKEASAHFAKSIVKSTLHSKNIWWYMLNGPKSDGFEKLLRKHSDRFTDAMMGMARPLVEMYIGTENLKKLRQEVQDITVNEIEEIIQYMHNYTDQALDLENEIATKMAQLPYKTFERVLHPVFEKDEIKLIIVGAILGAGVGAIQMYISLVIQGVW